MKSWIPIAGGATLAAIAAAFFSGKSSDEAASQPVEATRTLPDTVAFDYRPADPMSQTPTLNTGIVEQGLDVSALIKHGNRAPYISARAIIARIQSKDKTVFNTRYRANDLVKNQALRSLGDLDTGRITVVLDSYADARYFGVLMSSAWMLREQEGPAAKIGDLVLNWMYYNRWECTPSFREEVCAQLATFSCQYDGRIPSHQHRAYPKIKLPLEANPASYSLVGSDMHVWPAFYGDERFESHDGKEYKAGGCFLQDELTTQQALDWADASLPDSFMGIPIGASHIPPLGPPGVIVEYAIAQYMQFCIVSLVDPAQGAKVGQSMLQSANDAMSVAAAGVGLFAAGASAIPFANIVAWVGAAVVAIGKFLVALFSALESVERNRDVREAVCKKIESFLAMAWTDYGHVYNSPIESFLSGYHADILIPQGHWNGIDLFDDITDPLYHEYCLVSSRTARACPQLPFFYLNIDFPFPVSIDVFTNEWVVIKPILQDGLVVDWKQMGYSFQDLGKVIQQFYANNPLR